ncbi:MAG TPA: polysaccharide pyruvyl transferase family protein [Acetobacteraceae bacterium]|jgi:polysaccharide pyruvyl transferase WcaK-like protein|nr:polysaccharide pyruvyl transferase family protein [Acetobacteraceae bacterium]
MNSAVLSSSAICWVSNHAVVPFTAALQAIFGHSRQASVRAGQAKAVRSSAMGKRRICLLGLFGLGNMGNDGSLESMLLHLRRIRPDAELCCICVDPIKVSKDHRIPTIPISWPGFSNPMLKICDRISAGIPGKLANWVRAIRHLRRFDILIIPGTSTLCDYRADPLGPPYALFRWSAAAKLCGTKLYFISTGAGPISRPLSRWMLTRVAAWANYRSFRDSVSKRFIASLGIDTRTDAIFPDLAFSLPVPNMAPPPKPDDHPVTIGLGMMDYKGWQTHSETDIIYSTYLEKMNRFAHWLLSRGYRVRLLIGETADERAVIDLKTALAESGYRIRTDGLPAPELCHVITETADSLHDIMEQMIDTDIIVASRFHNVVCALKLSKPTISIGYEAKNDDLMEHMGLGAFCQHIERFDVDDLIQQFEALLLGKSLYEGRVRRKLALMQETLARQEQVFEEIL